jgi:hypothetical protein
VEAFGCGAWALDDRKAGRKERRLLLGVTPFPALCEGELGRKTPARSLSGKDHMYGGEGVWPPSAAATRQLVYGR